MPCNEPFPLHTSCQSLNLTYNPNEEPNTEFRCLTPLNWSSLPVRLEPSNQCSLVCHGLVVLEVTCTKGVWTGKPEQGFWCNIVREGVGTG